MGDGAWLAAYAGLVRQEVTRQETLSDLFDRKTCLVPVPGSSPSPAGVWAAERLARALCGVGLGASVWLGLRRHHAVRKSATASSADRPTVGQHMNSLSVMCRTEPLPERVILIDDVITRGRTILAAAARLHEALPHADIRAFALVRTMSFVAQLTHFFEPCQGVVRWAGGDARREP